MGKRTDFERIPRDLYPTPREAVLPLLRYQIPTSFYEPCAGNGALTDHLGAFGFECVGQSDLHPADCPGVGKRDAMTLSLADVRGASHFITNPPWPAKHGRGQPTLGLISHLSSILPTWFLLGADFMHNVYADDAMAKCRKIVSVGRVKWMPGTKFTGYENAAWYLFWRDHYGPSDFYPRQRKFMLDYAEDADDLI